MKKARHIISYFLNGYFDGEIQRRVSYELGEVTIRIRKEQAKKYKEVNASHLELRKRFLNAK